MLLAEFLCLIGALGATGVGLSSVIAWTRQHKKLQVEVEERDKARRQALAEALRSKDYARLDDWLILHGHEVAPDLRKHIETRRDDLYLEANP